MMTSDQVHRNQNCFSIFIFFWPEIYILKEMGPLMLQLLATNETNFWSLQVFATVKTKNCGTVLCETKKFYRSYQITKNTEAKNRKILLCGSEAMITQEVIKIREGL